MNKFKKYCPNVWVAECDSEHKKGEIIELETKYGKLIECEVYNLIKQTEDNFYYSIIRLDEPYAKRKAEKYKNSVINNQNKSDAYFQASMEGREFLSLGEPIKVGHHSEKRHRALIDRNHKRIEKSIEFAEKSELAEQKADYWEDKSKEITLANPDCLTYFTDKLEKAVAHHQGLKNGTIEKTHSYDVQYANKTVKELKNKVEIATLLWN